MPRGNPVVSLLPLLPAVAGVWLSAARFRAHQELAGLAFALGGVLVMLVVILRMDARRGGRAKSTTGTVERPPIAR